MKVNVFVDMDGVLAVYDKNVVNLMYDKEFFLNRPIIKPMVELVNKMISSDYNVYILTSVIDSEYCIPEKAMWLKKVLPSLSDENKIYVPYGTVKSDFAQTKVNTENAINVLIDDYTENLDKWTLSGALPVKVMNGINGTNGSWVKSGGKYIDAYSSVNENFQKMNNLITKELMEVK